MDLRYADVINENADTRAGIEKIIHDVLEIYGKGRRNEGRVTVFAADQPTFKSMLWIFYDRLEHGENDLSTWAVPTPGGFHNEKKGILRTLKWCMAGSGMEGFLPDNGISESPFERFETFGHGRRNRRFFFQLAAASVINI